MDTKEQLIGTVIDGKYRLDRVIGNGGMGAVYGGTHVQLGRNVAVKVLRSDLVIDDTLHARFVREARASARIEHPNAIRVYDFGALDDFGTYLVMEFADGVSLRQLLADRGRLSLDLALDLLQQAAAALDSAHANGIIHRDVKPENMMVCFGADGRPVLKVVDFGIAKLLSSDGTTQLTRPSDLIGTPRYMAPEQFTGEEIDGRIDVYALGVVLYEMLAGRPPFEGTFSEIIGKHIYAVPPPLGVEIPEEVARVVYRALAKSPDERPQSPIELASEFAEACGPEIVAAVAPPLGYILSTPSGSLANPAPRTDEVPTTVGQGTMVAGSSHLASAALAVDDYVTHVEFDVSADEATQVRPAPAPKRRRPSAKIVVPLSEGATSAFDRVRSTARMFVPPVMRAKWAAPAVLALAGCVTFGTVAYQGHGEASAVTPPAHAVQAAPVVEERPAMPDAATAVTTAPDPAPAERPRQTERRKASGEARPQNDSAIKKVGRALRVDRQLRKLF